MISDVVAVSIVFGLVMVIVVGMIRGISFKTKISDEGFHFEAKDRP